MMRSFIIAMSTLLACSLLANPGPAQELTQSGMAGGTGGASFADTRIPDGARVAEVRISSGNVVDSVQMVYELPNGRIVAGPRHGGPGGRLNSFRLDSDEYITAVSGRSGEYIDSIRIHTNKRSSQLFGGPGGSQEYRVSVDRGHQAIAFYGRAGEFVDAIGLIQTPITSGRAGQTTVAGGRGGSPFEDDVPAGARISEVRIYAGNNIDGIQVVYALRNGRKIEGPVHGGTGGRVNVVRLDSDEHITAISGRHGIYVDSITIHTNKRTSRTFGGRGGSRAYRIEVPARSQAVGFIGRAGNYVDAIGLKYGTLQERRPGRRR